MILSIFSSYIFPVEFDRKTFTPVELVPKPFPLIVIAPFLAGFWLLGLRDMMVGAEPEASVYVKLKLESDSAPKVTVTVWAPRVEQAGT